MTSLHTKNVTNPLGGGCVHRFANFAHCMGSDVKRIRRSDLSAAVHAARTAMSTLKTDYNPLDAMNTIQSLPSCHMDSDSSSIRIFLASRWWTTYLVSQPVREEA